MKQNARFPIFRHNLNTLMQNEHMNTTEFAEKLGLSRQTVGFYLNGDRIPDALTLRLICERCSVSADWLLGLSLEPNPDRSIQGACSYTGLSGRSLMQLHDLPLGLRDIANDIIAHPSFYEMLWVVSRAWALRIQQGENEQMIAQIEENADDEIIAAQDYLHGCFIESMPYDLASELYFENAKSIFGRIIQYTDRPCNEVDTSIITDSTHQ